ncbi:ATP-dependent Clp protease adapter ClpS [soil metagenome]
MNKPNHEHEENEIESGVVTKEARPKLKMPPLFKVLILNDDFTPMDFVITILEQFFFMERTKAVQIMLQVHTQGRGICGVYPRDIAETKVMQVTHYSRDQNYPLLCTMEEA